MTNEQKAARLREMVKQEIDMAETLAGVRDKKGAAWHRKAAKSLLAGAEAIEAVAVAKKALLEITCGCHPPDSDVTRATCATADRALARLEAL